MSFNVGRVGLGSGDVDRRVLQSDDFDTLGRRRRVKQAPDSTGTAVDVGLSATDSEQTNGRMVQHAKRRSDNHLRPRGP